MAGDGAMCGVRVSQKHRGVQLQPNSSAKGPGHSHHQASGEPGTKPVFSDKLKIKK